tara:strand:+ start:6062 stop:7153 length:1092 start_codon:yes stop_codon:yes gene_type:complete
MKVSFLELIFDEKLQSTINESILKISNSSNFIGGKEVEYFEKEYAKFLNLKETIAVGNGYDALVLSLKALEISSGDEVIVPSNTFIATWLAIVSVGAKPIPVEPIEKTYNIDYTKIEKVISKKTKAIIPVHLYGQPCNLDPIISIAKKYNIKVIEDAAQAHGAKYKGKLIGAHGDLVAWSFYPGKNLGAYGDAGAITTNNSKIAKKLRSMRNYGSEVKYKNDVIGINSRMDSIQAVILRKKLKRLKSWNKKRSSIANFYKDQLNDSNLILPFTEEWASPVWHLFCIRHSKRNILMEKLKRKGIETLIHYPIAPYNQKAFKYLKSSKKYPLTDKISKELLSLPIGPHLNEEKCEYVCDSLKKIL